MFHAQKTLRKIMRKQNSRHQGPQQTCQTSRRKIQTALSFLERRFSEYPIEAIIFSLQRRLQQDRQLNRNSEYFEQNFVSNLQEQDQYQENNYRRPPPPPPARHRYTQEFNDPRQVRDSVPDIATENQQRLAKFEVLRGVAKIFCQTGDNYNLANSFFQITNQQFSSYLNTINSQALKQIHIFLRFQCNIRVDQFTSQSKKILQPKLKKVRHWLGRKSQALLATYLKFIVRHYQDKSIEITYDEALALYKSLLQIARSPNIDIMSIYQDNYDRSPTPHIVTDQTTAPIQSYSKQQKIRIIDIYLQQKDVAKVSQILKDQLGEQNNKKLYVKSIKELLKYIIKCSLKKAITTILIKLKGLVQVHFHDSDSLASKIFTSELRPQLRIKLLNFYKTNKVTTTEIIKMVNEINQLNASDDAVSMFEVVNKDEEISIIPKVQFDGNIEKSIARSNRQAQKSILAGKLQEKVEEQTAPSKSGDLETLPDDENVEAKEEVIIDKGSYQEMIEIQ